jgi:hypothetical protein
MTRTLRWCAGKFIRPRGSAELLHFMRLDRFIIDDALDYGHLFVLRALRHRADDRALRDDQLDSWMRNTAVKVVAELAAHLLRGRPGGVGRDVTVAELYPGVGCTYEYLKLLLERERRGTPPRLRYHACGPESCRLKFEVLHADDGYAIDYAADADAAAWLQSQAHADLVLFNHDQAVRYSTETAVGLDTFLTFAGPAVLAARVTHAPDGRVVTTVKGRAVYLPALGHVQDQCCRANPAWMFHYVAGFDKDYFLPDGQGETGLLLGYLFPGAVPSPGFGPSIPARTKE